MSSTEKNKKKEESPEKLTTSLGVSQIQKETSKEKAKKVDPNNPTAEDLEELKADQKLA